VRHQSVEPDRQVAAVADAEALKFISGYTMGWSRCVPRGHGALENSVSAHILSNFRTVIRIQSLVELLDSGRV